MCCRSRFANVDISSPSDTLRLPSESKIPSSAPCTHREGKYHPDGVNPNDLKSRGIIYESAWKLAYLYARPVTDPLKTMGVYLSLLSQTAPLKSKFSTSDIPDLTTKVMIVTGANSGIGKETAKVKFTSWV